jgi:hypothetical protein
VEGAMNAVFLNQSKFKLTETLRLKTTNVGSVQFSNAKIFHIFTRMTKTIDEICFFGSSVIHPHDDVPFRIFALIGTICEERQNYCLFSMLIV